MRSVRRTWARDWARPAALIVPVTVVASVAGQVDASTGAALRGGCGVVAIGVLVYRAYHSSARSRLAWLLLAVGIGGWVFGDGMWDGFSAAGVPDSSLLLIIPNLLYVSAYPVLFAGITRRGRPRMRRPDRGVLADCAVLFLISLVTLRGFLIPSGIDVSTADGFFTAMYPFGDALLLAGAAWAAFTGVRMTGAVRLVAAGLITVLVSDIAWEWQARVTAPLLSESVINAMYTVSYALVAAAALHPAVHQNAASWRDRASPQRSAVNSRVRLSLLYVSFAMMPVMVFTSHRHDLASRLSVVALVVLLALRFSAVVREARTAHAQAEANARRYLTLAETAPVAIYETDVANRVVYINGEGSAIVGPDAVGKDFRAVFNEIGLSPHHATVPDTRSGRGVPGRAAGQFQVRDASGVVRWLAWYAVPVRDPTGLVTGAIAATIDITAMKDAQEQLALQATHDPLTGLPNRRLLFDRLSAGLARSARQKGQVAVLFIDIDGFKVVNDRYGHDVGDELLQSVTARIQHTVRAEDTVARYGGDEFVVVVERVSDRRHAGSIANKIIEAVSRLTSINGLPISVSASIGIAIADKATDDPDVLVRHADEAMYNAKGSGSGLVRFYGTTSASAGHRVAVRGYR